MPLFTPHVFRMSRLLLLPLCELLLLASTVDACLPTGLGGIFGGGAGGCASRPGGCVAAQYSAPMPPPIYSFTPQMYPSPPPPPPPPALAPTRELPVSSSAAIAAASSYQGMYQDRPQAPSINPEYQGTAPLSFASSEDAANTVIDPLKYIEHVSVSHTPASPPTSAPESYPPSPPADPFVHKQQIQVAPSSASSEDTYLPGPPESSGEKNATLTTYYNQLCAGDTIATGEKETMNSAGKKCELLKCVAANAQPDSHGTFTVTYLKSANSRTNSKGNYCLSTIELPAKSKRVIRRFDEMTSNEVRRKIFKL